MLNSSFFRAFLITILVCMVVQVAVIAAYAVKPELFYYRAWEYFFRWANYTEREDSIWEGEELQDLSRRYLFHFQQKRHTYVSTDADGFRSVQDNMGLPRIFVQGRSNVFGSGLSDHETLPWMLAEKTGTAVFNGAHGRALSTLSRPGLEQVELVIDVYHERLFSDRETLLSVYKIKRPRLLAYRPLAPQNMSVLEALYRPIARPGYWIPDILLRWYKALERDRAEYTARLDRNELVLPYDVKDTNVGQVVRIMQQRRRIFERLGYHYLAVIIPSRQTMLGGQGKDARTRKLGTRVARRLRELDFPFVDLFSEYGETGSRQTGSRPHYFPYDTHWNPWGVEVAVDATARELQDLYPDVLERGRESARQAGADKIPVIRDGTE